jgi:hypothetical protein
VDAAHVDKNLFEWSLFGYSLASYWLYIGRGMGVSPKAN